MPTFVDRLVDEVVDDRLPGAIAAMWRLAIAPRADLSADGWTAERRRSLRQRQLAGDLTELEFDAVVFRVGRNANHIRFREGELDDFAASFVGVPFLRNHDTGDIGARDGTVIRSCMQGDAMRQTIRLTTERGIRDFLGGIIDRFSIGWCWARVECSICGRNWLDCAHYPGRTYQKGKREQVCELVFIQPRGKETSAVNAPAVVDTSILAINILSELCNWKENQAMTVGQEEGHAARNVEEQKDAILLPKGAVRSVMQRETDGGQTARAEGPTSAQRVDELIAGSGLPEQSQSLLRLACAGRAPGEAARLILEQQRAQASVLDRGIVQGIRPVTASHMQTPLDRMQEAMDWLFGVRDATPPPPSLRDIREIYQAVTGDHNWYGVFQPEWAQLASATSSTLSGMVVDALNRATRMHYDNLVTYRWYEQIVSVTPHAGTTHDVNLVMVDGLANLPTVSEGAAYTEATVGDSKESMSFTKYGHYVGITLETIRKSDIQRIQAIPRELVKAAIRARYRLLCRNGQTPTTGPISWTRGCIR